MKGFIYTLKCPMVNDIIYIGATTRPINVRLSCHKADSKILKTPLYEYIREHNIVPEIELLEEVEYNDRLDLYRVERFWIEQLRQWGFNLKNTFHIVGKSAFGENVVKYKKYPFDKLEIGYSFIIRDLSEGRSIYRYLISYNRNAENKIEITTRKEKEGIRVWRIK